MIILALGYLGMRGPPLTRNFPTEKLSTLEDEALGHGGRLRRQGASSQFPVHLYLDALPAVQPERVTVLR